MKRKLSVLAGQAGELGISASPAPASHQDSHDVTRLARGAGVSVLSKLAGRVLLLGSQVLLARLLGPEVFGLYVIGWTLLRVLGVLVPLGLDSGVIHFGSSYWGRDDQALRRLLRLALALALGAGLLAGAALFALAPWLAQSVFDKPELLPVLRWFAPALALLAGLKVSAAATRISQRMRYSALAEELAQPGANLLLIILFHALGWQLAGAALAGMLSFGLALALSLWYLKKMIHHGDTETQSFNIKNSASLCLRGDIKRLLIFSLPTSLAGMFSLLILWVDRLLLGYFLPAADVGVYQAVSQSSVLIAIILYGMNAIFAPMIAQLYHDGQLQRLEELFRVSTKWGLYLSLPLFIVMCFAPEHLIVVVFGQEYAGGALALVVLTLAQLVNVATGAVGNLLIMTGRQRHWFATTGSMFVVNIALNWLLIPRMGVLGSAIGTAVSIAGLFALGLLQVRRQLGLWPYDRRYLKGLLAAAVATLTLIAFRPVLDGISALNLLAIGALATALFVTTLLLQELDDEDRACIALLRQRLGRSGAR